MNKRWLVALGAVLAALMMSSCFSLRGFAWLRTTITVGEKNVALLSLYPHGFTNYTDYPFIIVGLPQDPKDQSTSLGVANPKSFDVDGRFGGPLPLQADPDIAALAPGAGGCNENGLDLGQMTGFLWKAYRTENEVADNGRVGREALTKLGIKSLPNTGGGARKIVFISGSWSDSEDDDVPQAAELDCTGMMFTTLVVRGTSE